MGAAVVLEYSPATTSSSLMLAVHRSPKRTMESRLQQIRAIRRRRSWNPPVASVAKSTRSGGDAAAGGGGGRVELAEADVDALFFRGGDANRPIMLFDGICNLCNGGVRLVRSYDSNRRIRYVPLQSETGKRLLKRAGRSPDDISSVVLVEKSRSYVKSEAVLRIMQYLELPFPQVALTLKLIPLFLRDFVYDNVASNRYSFFGRSEQESCEILE